MCGRYAQGFAVRAIAQQLERGDMGIDDIRDLDNHYPSYNVAPTNFQPVYRRERSGPQDLTSDRAAPQDGEASDTASSRPTHATQDMSVEQPTVATTSNSNRHILQGMKWGLIPFWTKRPPDNMSQLKTINCRDDSLIENRGMWNSMKGRKRCIIPVQGYYEWFKKGPKEKIPHFTRHRDGKMMLLAGLYDCVQYEGAADRIWTYTIITTAANTELAWLHDRMPLIFDQGTDQIRNWLDDDAWSQDLVKLLKPYEGQLDCYPVKKEVGKVGTNSPDYIIPIDSTENKSNIANFFHKQASISHSSAKLKAEEQIKQDATESGIRAEDNKMEENNAPMVDLEQESPGKIEQKHPVEPRTPSKDMLYENDLPFRFIPSHLETRGLETIDVFTAAIDTKSTGQLIHFINSTLRSPKEDLSHLKRIKSNRSAGDAPSKKIKLEEGEPSSTTLIEILLCSCASRSESDLLELLKKHDLQITPKITQVSKFPPLTPQQFSDWSNLWPLSWRVPAQRRIRMSRQEFEECEKIMCSTLDSASLMANSPELPVTAVAWDPVLKREIARASDVRQSTGHPLKHAIIELVAAVAAHETIRRLDHPDSPAQYLCSNLYIFITHEPCTMCCMALLHSRVSHVFYAEKMDRTGGFESSYGIHWRSELNHRFIVYGGWMKERAMYIEDNTYV